MIKRNQKSYNWINRLSDMAIIYISYIAAVWFWILFLEKDSSNISVRYAIQNPFPVLLIAFGFVVIFQYGGMYDSFRFNSLISELAQLLKLFVVCMALSATAIFLLKIANFSRGVVAVTGIIAFILLCLKRALLRFMLREMRRRGYNQKYVLIVGDSTLAFKYLVSIDENPSFGFQSIGYVGKSGRPELGRWLGDYTELEPVLEEYGPDEVVIALEQDELDMMNVIVSCCEEQGIKASIIPFYSDYLPACATVDTVGRVRLINIRLCPLDIGINRFVKRCFDIVFSLVAILLTSPLLLITAIGVKLSSPGPVLFRQKRVGKDRRSFYMYKFRSMRLNDDSDRAWSRATDSRITPFGAFIRKFSIDELPQFFNVLRGEMSVIGPRPELPYFVEQYKYEIPRYMVKHQVKPGITGWAQVNGYRGDTSIEKRIEHDIWYIENWSLALDIKIVFMTVFGGMINNEKNILRRKEREMSIK